MSLSTAEVVGLCVVPHTGKGEEIDIEVLDGVLYHFHEKWEAES